MSFHGGLCGFILASYLIAKKYKLSTLKILDVSAIIAPLCLFFGRLMNFVNGELYGRATDGSWGVVFTSDELTLLRHPSQLYEAFLEGLVTFGIMLYASKNIKNAKSGFFAALFVLLYGTFRFIVEFFREPDEQVGYIFEYFTLGQMLCVFMILIGSCMMASSHDPKTLRKHDLSVK